MKIICHKRPDQTEYMPYNPQETYLCLFNYEEFEKNVDYFQIPHEIVKDVYDNHYFSFENWASFALFSLQIPHELNAKDSFSHMHIFIRQNMLIFISKKHQLIEEMFRDFTENKEQIPSLSFEFVLFTFFNRLISDDFEVMEKIEREITDLEESLIASVNLEYTKQIFVLRKKLLLFKKYYEQFIEITEGLIENNTQAFQKNQLVLFRKILNKLNRLYNNVLHITDYVSQVREAYQSQTDINLNKTMKLFTVLTAIFLPLTMIVGWYGMNFKMPEFDWKYGYAYVGILCLVVMVIEWFYFHKNKWLK